MLIHILYVLQYLLSFNLFVGLSFLADLVVFFLHFLSTISHLNHHSFKLLDLGPSDLSNGLSIVFLYLFVLAGPALQQPIANMPDVYLSFLTALDGLHWVFVKLLGKGVDERGKFRSVSIIALMILFSESCPTLLFL